MNILPSKNKPSKNKLPSAKFRFEAYDTEGKRVSGTELAASSGAVHLALLEKGFQPIEVTEKKSILKFEITKKKVPRKDVMNFTRQLAVFIRSGIPIMEALEVIVEETPNKLLNGIIKNMVDDLRAGDTFAAAASSHSEAFPPFYVGILESAELTGNLDGVLNQLADYIERDLKARGRISAALIYPAVVSVMSVVTVIVLGAFVLPRFVVFFNSLNAKLPLPTRMLLNSSSFMSTYWYIIFAVVIALLAGFTSMRRSLKGRARLDQILLKLPVVGDLTQTAILERVCRVLSSMLRAGVDLPRSMTITAEASNNAIYRNALLSIRDEMMEGQGLSGPIARSGLFPGAARQMFRVGEETGSLDQQLEVAATYYSRELETKLERATSLFEPAVIILMGLVVGFVAVALISAMYGIYSQVKQ
jgi:type IV pilus assembly protein PilC